MMVNVSAMYELTDGHTHTDRIDFIRPTDDMRGKKCACSLIMTAILIFAEARPVSYNYKSAAFLYEHDIILLRSAVDIAHVLRSVLVMGYAT